MAITFRIESVPQEEKSVLRNLLELCQHDYSEFNGEDVDGHGVFGYSYLDNYWTEQGRHAFFIRVESKLAGFVMVRRLEQSAMGDLHGIAEFFILRKYRRLGLGRHVAMRIFDLFPGRWSVDQEPGNIPAQRFWRSVIAEYTGGDYVETVLEYNGEQRPNQRFTSREKQPD